MDRFENKLFEGIHYSRFIASFVKSGGNVFDRKEFTEWLLQLMINGKHMTEDEAYDIYYLGSNGKMELESNAEHWLENRES